MTLPSKTTGTESRLASLRDQIEAALEAILGPLLRGRRLKLWLSPELPRLACGNWLALTGPGLQLSLEHAGHVPTAGPAVAVLFNLPLLLQEANADEETAAALFGATAAHEAAHTIEHIPCTRDPADSSPDSAVYRSVLAKVADLPADPTPWHGHGPEWIRAAHHIAARLRSSGFAAPASQVFCGQSLGLSPAGFYWGAAGMLREESERFGHLPLHRMLARAPPAALARWFETDLSDYRNSFTPDDEKTMITNLFEKLRGVKKREELTTAEAFRQLAKRIAAGDDPDPEKVLRIIEPAGKTIEDLEKAVALITRRRQLAETVKAGRQAAKKMPRLQKDLAENIAAWEAAEAPFEDNCRRLEAEIIQTEASIKAGQAAATDLEGCATDPEITARVHAAHEARTRNQNRIQHLLTHRARTLESQLISTEVAAAKELTPSIEKQDQLKTAHDRIAALDDEVARLRAELPDLEAALDAARAELLDPLAI
jgi:hypothetical protein